MPYAVMQIARGKSRRRRLCRCSGNSPPPSSMRWTRVSALPVGHTPRGEGCAYAGPADCAAKSGAGPTIALGSPWEFTACACAAGRDCAASVRLTTMAGTAMKAVTLCAAIRSKVDAALKTGWNTCAQTVHIHHTNCVHLIALHRNLTDSSSGHGHAAVQMCFEWSHEAKITLALLQPPAQPASMTCRRCGTKGRSADRHLPVCSSPSGASQLPGDPTLGSYNYE